MDKTRELTVQERLNLDIVQCRRCLYVESCRGPVPGSGGLSARIMVVGEAPGEHEDTEGEPFIGPSGAVLREVFMKAGVDLSKKAYITNIVKCRPVGNATPLQKAVEACKGWLMRETREVSPRLVIMLGRVAQRNVLPYTSDMPHGSGWSLDREYLYLHHPGYWLRCGGSSWADDNVLPVLNTLPWREKGWI